MSLRTEIVNRTRERDAARFDLIHARRWLVRLVYLEVITAALAATGWMLAAVAP